MNNQIIDWQEFSRRVEKLIVFASDSTCSPINADRWEEIIFHTLKSMDYKYKGEDPKWISGSHAPGADLWTDDVSISAKAGKISKGYLIISSYRLTRFDELSEMINYIDGPGRNFDIYLCCARDDSKTTRNYKIYLIKNDIFSAASLSWSEVYGKNMTLSGWRGQNDEGIIVSIRRKMSNQLWMEFPLNKCHLLTEISIPNNMLGIALEKNLEKLSNLH